MALRNRRRRRLLVSGLSGVALLAVAATAGALASNYKVGTLVGGTAYNSIERTWYGDQIYNGDSQNIGAARLWGYKTGVGYVYDNYPGIFLPAGQVLLACFNGTCGDISSTRAWCQSSNTRSGSCAGLYH